MKKQTSAKAGVFSCIACCSAGCYNKIATKEYHMLTLIQCFDPIPLKNIIGCLRLKPEKLIFLGDEKVMQASLPRYKAFLKSKGIKTEIRLYDVDTSSTNDILKTMRSLTKSEKECIIDITGGKDSFILAAGILMGEQNIRIQKFDSKSGLTIDLDRDGNTISGETAKLSAEELIRLMGGIIHPEFEEPPKSYPIEKIEPLWRFVAKDPRAWNRNVSVLYEFERRSASKKEIILSKKTLSESISGYKEKEKTFVKLIEGLRESGVIEDMGEKGLFHYRYTDSVLQEAVRKAGNILEMKTLFEARTIKKDGKAYFNDCQMSVTIDWDGIIQDQENYTPETRNEIDVLLMRGVTPLFISCKNGSIGEEELYKLNTVALRFGSPLAKKMLIATDLEDRNSMSGKAFIQRARDMGIYVVPNAAELSRREWAEELQKAMEN